MPTRQHNADRGKVGDLTSTCVSNVGALEVELLSLARVRAHWFEFLKKLGRDQIQLPVECPVMTLERPPLTMVRLLSMHLNDHVYWVLLRVSTR